MEIAMLVVLFFLLVTCYLQKKQFATTRPLTHLTVVNILLLACQALEWLVMRQECLEPVPNVLLIKRITYGLDYALYYWVAFCFFRYITVYIAELRAGQGRPEKKMEHWVRFLAVWGAVISAVFMLLIFNERFYYIKADGQETFHASLYRVMYLLGLACVIASSVLLVRNYRALKRQGFWLLLGYVVLPHMVAYIDVVNGLCISYILTSFFVFILYVEIDLRRGNLILEQEANLTELRTKIMLSQMQPHFLYNTLTTISGLCYLEGAEQAKEVVDKFSDYFRANLDSMGKDNFIPFEKELEHIKTYLWLEQVRFGDALSVEYKIGPTDFALPSLTLQPIAENAVKHGIRKKKGGGTVTIETLEGEREYIIRIRDDGAGFDPAERFGEGRSHIGLDNITERLRILKAGSIEIQSKKGAGTVVTVYIAKERRR